METEKDRKEAGRGIRDTLEQLEVNVTQSVYNVRLT